MKILHFILIVFLIALPSGAIWLYFDAHRESEQAGLFGNIKPEGNTTPIPPIFWEDPIIVNPEATAPDIGESFIPDGVMDRIEKEVINDMLEPMEKLEPTVLPEPLSELDVE